VLRVVAHIVAADAAGPTLAQRAGRRPITEHHES
jgi:hypothetical protein